MSTHLAGQPLKQANIDVMKSQILLCLRSTTNFPVPLHVAFDFCLHGDESRVNEFGVALRQLEELHEIKTVNFGPRYFLKLASNGEKGAVETASQSAPEKFTCGTVEGHGEGIASRSPRLSDAEAVTFKGGVPPTGIAPAKQMPNSQSIGLSPASAAGSEYQASPAGNSPWDTQRSIVRPKEEVHLEFCSADCGRVASGYCDCGAPVCSAHRYGTDEHHDPKGMCGKCYDEAVMNGGIQ